MGPRGRVLLGAAGAAAGVAAWATLVEPRLLRVRRVELAPPSWPAALDGLRVALVSDLHAGAPHFGAHRIAAVADRVRAEHADVALLLGDFVDPAVTLATPVALADVAGPLGRLGAPLGTYAVLGNHDWIHGGAEVAQALQDVGVAVLENDARAVGAAAAPLWVAGVADMNERLPDLERTLAPVPGGATVILLTHDPDLFPRVPARVALTVAGHTHGGQVDVPVVRRRVIPSLHGERFKAGHVVEDGRHLYVTSGVGVSGFPVRLLRPPEVVVLTLRPPAA